MTKHYIEGLAPNVLIKIIEANGFDAAAEIIASALTVAFEEGLRKGREEMIKEEEQWMDEIIAQALANRGKP
jgi:hypothetical protein